MTPEQRGTLLKLADEYGDSLVRSDSEKDHQKAIAARANSELGIGSRHFVKLATALHKDTVAQEREDLEIQADLFDVARGEKSRER